MNQLNFLGPADLQLFLELRAIPAEILFLETATPTVSAAAAALGVAESQIMKTIQFMVSGEAVLALACGTARIDQGLVAKYLGVGRKKVKLANENEVLQFGGYPVGTVPPFAHRQPLIALMDHAVFEQEIVFAGGGAKNAMLRIAPAEIKRHANVRMAHLIHPPID